jgi:hypothetical protein
LIKRYEWLAGSTNTCIGELTYITPSGLKTQALPIFYNNATPSGLKYIALNPEGVI